jgi:YbbR domain-containing protein
VDNVTIDPALVKVNLILAQMSGYRDLAVKVVTVGQLSSGYRLINITAFPLIVTVFSDNVALVSSLPGYVETTPLDLTNASGNINTNLALSLPPGVSPVGDQTVSVQIEIVPIEGSLKVSYRPVEVVGLASGLKAQFSPTTVDVILSGPLPSLNSLLVTDVHVRINLTGLGVGTYQLTPAVTISNTGVAVQSILPAKVEVVITSSATPTP